VPPPRGPPSRLAAGSARGSSRSKRDEILRTATAYSGETGYEAAKLADVASAVGIGSTALYHYFESKLHCLYVIMADALEFYRDEFNRRAGAHDDYLDALLSVLRGSYELSDHEVLRNRVLVAEQGLVGVRRTSPREEEARAPRRAPSPETSNSRGLRFSSAAWSRGCSPERTRDADPRAARPLQQRMALVPARRAQHAR
jgi:TetR/AcrR family transcriptional regulator, cholesterol catabolism regulator